MKLSPKQVKERFEKLAADRVTWEHHWQEIGDYVIPNKNQIQRKTSPGDKRNVHLYDSTALQAVELLAGALHGMLTNPSSVWFELSTGNEKLDSNDRVRFFLQDTAKKMNNIFNNSNFQTEIHEVYLDLVAFGTAAMAIEEDDKNVIRFGARQINEVFVSESNLGMIDEVYRKFKWSPKQIAQEFGVENLSKNVAKAFNENRQETFSIIHAIYPDMEGQKVKGIFNYHSQYILEGEEFELRHSGFREMPMVVPRWTKAAGEIYGRSPAMNALPDVKMINEVMKATIKAAQKTVDPPLQLPDDGFILPIVTKPGGLNYYRAGSADRIEPFANDGRVDFGFQMLNDMRGRIRDCFYIDQLQLGQGPQMTATEVNQRTEEKMRMLGPMLGRQNSELLTPLIDRAFEIMLRKGIIDRNTIPEELAGRKLDVRYSSLIAKAQRTSEGQNLLRAIQTVAPLISTDPTAMDNINIDEAVRFVFGLYGIPQEIYRTEKERDAIRQGRADAQKQMNDQAMQAGQLDNAQKVADIAQVARQA